MLSDLRYTFRQLAKSPGFAAAYGGVFLNWQDSATQLKYIAAIHNCSVNLTGTGEPVRRSVPPAG